MKSKLAAEQTNLLFALFNNPWRRYAPQNAIDMMKTLELPFKELPIQVPLKDEEVPKEQLHPCACGM